MAASAGAGSLGPAIERPVLPANGTDWLGRYGETFVDTIALAAGVVKARPDPDVTGTDRFFQDPRTGEIIRIQVKATENPNRLSSGDFSFDLDVATFGKLRKGSSQSYLALVVVHQEHPRWASHLHRGSLIRAACYTASVKAMDETVNETTVSVSLPLVNLLTPGSLLRLFPTADEGGGADG